VTGSGSALSAPRDPLPGEPEDVGPTSEWPVGTRVFLPGRGLGTVVAQELCAPLGTPREYLAIRVERCAMTVRIPLDRAGELGVRGSATADEIRAAIAVLGSLPETTEVSWQRRIKLNHDKLSDGGLLGVAEVLRDLTAREWRRPLGLQEQDQRKLANDVLEGHIAHALDLEETEARAVLKRALPAPGTTD
jgi:RNA polymerase-interacting CarD/CdnL/TRCF family regulator